MELFWYILIYLHHITPSQALLGVNIRKPKPHPWIERYHYPGYYTTAMTVYINGTDTQIPGTKYTPDYRVEEKHYTVYGRFFKEQERPYRISPIYHQTKSCFRYKKKQCWPQIENPQNLGCYCCATYRRSITLAGCAVLTTRHVLTTANPTVLILRSYGHLDTLEGILGGWYDINARMANSSLYFTPARIHIHPQYKYDYEVNVSHPVPVMYDLSLWAATYKFYGTAYSYSSTVLCYRAASGWFEYASTIPRKGDLVGVVGYQFMKSYARRPLPWHRYVVKTKSHVWPCPKSDWHWFHCVMGEYWGRLGFDSGGAMHMFMEKKSNRVDGFSGMCSFSLKLRAFQTTHYFTVVDTYPVLDFMYDAYLGLSPYVYLDARFQDTKWAAPVVWWGEYVATSYVFGYEHYSGMSPIPWYR